ncbi:MAG: DUF3570 domain-containing protein [candidate division KSB1 bacterium]|nr:DUF3570 domain-containing protein [candidate division KSB1 bacterium]MDQ7064784.1 DUF3570 domain-containing protein [candidate division KSB1 bacterium]
MVKRLVAGLCALLLASPLRAQDLPDNELQVAINSYFDNFNVKIVYPTISMTKRFSDSSTVSVRYLVDVISAASMRSHFNVDGVTSATENEDGGGDDRPDEVRHEIGLGVNELLTGGLLKGGTFSLNALYSREHDYSSFTLASLFTYLLAKKNTTLQFGFVRSWDRVFPQIRTWTRKKDVYTYSFNFTQILSPIFIMQVILSYNNSHGYLADPYQVVRIIEGDRVATYETSHPDRRIRKAIGLRLNYKVGPRAALNFGVRYYWDSWDVNSLTTNILYQQYLHPAVILGLGLRNYIQDRAFFFKPQYLRPEEYMTVDTKLNENYSNNYQIKLSINGGYFKNVPFFQDENLQVNFILNFYHRHSATPDWHSRLKNLYAYILSFSVRYHF